MDGEDYRCIAADVTLGQRVEADFSSVTMPGELAESGRGVALALLTADEVAYRHDGDLNHWLVVRRRAA